jgi:hypothetical protein
MRKVAHAIIAFLLVLQGCATLSLPDYPKGTTASYSNAATINDLCVAVQPITKKADLEKYFGTNLNDIGIVPIYIISENRNSQTSFIISKDRVSLFNDKNTLDQGARTEESTAGRAVSLIGAALVSLPLLFIGPKMISDAEIIKHNLVRKELQTRTVSPGKSVDGFVYFKLPESSSADRLKDWRISLEAMELGSNIGRNFTFPAE